MLLRFLQSNAIADPDRCSGTLIVERDSVMLAQIDYTGVLWLIEFTPLAWRTDVKREVGDDEVE